MKRFYDTLFRFFYGWEQPCEISGLTNFSYVFRRYAEMRRKTICMSRVTGETFSEDYALVWKKYPIPNYGND